MIRPGEPGANGHRYTAIFILILFIVYGPHCVEKMVRMVTLAMVMTTIMMAVSASAIVIMMMMMTM